QRVLSFSENTQFSITIFTKYPYPKINNKPKNKPEKKNWRKEGKLLRVSDYGIRYALMSHHEGEVQGEPEDEDERPLLLLESLPEVPRDLASLRETEQASAGSFFIGVNGGVNGLDDNG
ncbi:hypothetical protein PanWU01x14_165240, partial [Parasponia andersonii]